MYEHGIELQIAGAEHAVKEPIEQYGIRVYVDTHPDICGCDFKIDPADTKGIEIFRKFAGEFAAHLNTLKNKAS